MPSVTHTAMHKRFDRLVKQVFHVALQARGQVLTEHEVGTDPQSLDVCFVPAPGAVHAGVDLGLLGRMASEPCLFEATHETPAMEDVLQCVRRQLTWWTVLQNDARRRKDPAPAALPVLWVLSSGRPRSALKSLGATPLAHWPRGIHAAATGWRLRIVVLAELPRSQDTLLLRLLGAGATLRGAVRDLLALPPGAWEKLHVLPLLVALRIELMQDPTVPSEEEDFIVNTQELVDAFRQEALDEGMKKGLEKGLATGRAQGLALLVRQFERRLDRALTTTEHATLRQRLDTVGPVRLGDVVLDMEPGALSAWLADPAAR